MSTLVYEVTHPTGGYEVRTKPMTWATMKYITQRRMEVSDDKQGMEFIEELAGRCFDGWRMTGSEEWCKVLDDLPQQVLLSWINHLIAESGKELTVQVRAEKN